MSLFDFGGRGRLPFLRGGTGTVIDPGVLDELSNDIAEVVPLLLLPMRLEYRVVEQGEGSIVRDSVSDLEEIAATRAVATGGSLAARRKRGEARRALISELRNRPMVTAKSGPQAQPEIWFRWYPDESFTEKGIEPARLEEKRLLEEFHASAAPEWWDLTNGDTSAAFQALAHAVGPYRAVHLLRTEGVEGDKNWEARIGRIALLPTRVHLFAIMGKQLQSLGSGAGIPQNSAAERSQVSYTYEAVEPDGWLQEFSVAETMGMGLRIKDPTLVKTALVAQGIIAVGTFSGSAVGEVETLLRDQIANGKFEILSQDESTNNSPSQPTTHIDPRYDLISYLGRATQLEQGAYAGTSAKSAELLSEALGLDPAELRKATNGLDGSFEDARAMLRVIGPALLDSAVDGVTVLKGVDENEFIEVMAKAIVARGALPAVRFGRNAYGIAPITPVNEFSAEEAGDEIEKKVHRFLARYASIVREFVPAHAERVVPVLAPDDLQASDKVAEILKSNRVSVRVDVAIAGSDKTASIGCPYVRGANKSRQPATYLQNLRTKPLETLPDPTENDISWPLLYRLARLTLTRNTLLPVLQQKIAAANSLHFLENLTQAQIDRIAPDIAAVRAMSATGFADLRPNVFTGLNIARRARLQSLNRNFAAGLKRLETIAARPNGIAELETLMLEVFDLFQHRVDAWAVGLAYARLKRNRESGQKGLQAGYFGFLGKLRPQSATGAGDGYIQAPTMAQATSAAILRSAHLRHRSTGAFAVNLRSKRMRQALGLLNYLKIGLSIQEALGLRGERWLHDHKLSRLTLPLRTRLPIQNVTPPEGGAVPGPSGRRVFNGRRLVKQGVQGFPAADRPHINALRAALTDDLDALSDLVIAEAVHHRALGAAEVANAWLQVLSGEPVPGEPVFPRTLRQGQGSTYRISFLVDEHEPGPDAGPREMAEPSLAALTRLTLQDFESTAVMAKVTRVNDPSQTIELTIGLQNDLHMSPLDLLIGGQSELQVRIRNWLVSEWLTSSSMLTALGSPSALGLDAFIAAEVAIELDLSGASNSVEVQLERAERLRKLVQQGRVLEASDLNAAADPKHVLDEATHMNLITGAAVKLRGRCIALAQKLNQDANALATAQRAFFLLIETARGRIESNATEAEIASALNQAEIQRQDLLNLLREAASYALPAALRIFTLQEALVDTTIVEDRILEIESRLLEKRILLTSTLTASANLNFTTLSEARGTLEQLSAALQGAVDGEALPIFPSYARTSATEPLLESAISAQNALGEWAPVRRRVSDTSTLANDFAGVMAHPVSADATRDDAVGDDADPRPENLAPRSLHLGLFLGTNKAIRSGTSFVGFVCDEWAEQRPSEIQQAAMAINYDSPQSEPPHCLLLCVPPTAKWKLWSVERAARMVLESMAWMKVRALSTDDKLTPAALMPNGNQVSRKKVGNRSQPRIPRKQFRFKALDWAINSGAFVPIGDSDSAPVGFSDSGGNERSGFFRVKE